MQQLLKRWIDIPTVFKLLINLIYINMQDYKNHIEEEIVTNKQLRKDLDEKIQVVINLPKSRERALAITKLEEAVMWLGMDLKRLGSINPYPSSKDPSTGSVVEPTSDGLKFSN